MVLGKFVVRFLALASLTIWLGGFTFYSAIVVKIMHEHLDSMDAGSITQEVTDALNIVGAAALILLWTDWFLARRERSKFARRAGLVLMIASSLCLGFLFGWHEFLDRRLESQGLTGFYPLHEVYLIVHTVLWFLQLGIISGFVGGRSSHGTAEAHAAHAAPEDHDPRPAG